MPEFEDIDAFLAPTLDLPVAGKVYRVPSPPAAVGLRLQASFAVSAARRAQVEPRRRHVALLVDDPETSLEQDALGPVYGEMLADGVNLETINHAGMTAYLWIVAGESAARAYWVAPKGEARRPLPVPSTSTSTGEGNRTLSPASSSGTRSRRRRSGASSATTSG